MSWGAAESQFALDAERKAGLMGGGFARRVGERVRRVGRKHGERYRSFNYPRFCYEIEQEALDLCGWAALFLQILEEDRSNICVSEDEIVTARALLTEVAAIGARAEALTQALAGRLASGRVGTT